MSEAIRWLLQTAELNVLDAFPSRHVALSLVFLALGWRLFPSWRWRLALVLLVSGTQLRAPTASGSRCSQRATDARKGGHRGWVSIGALASRAVAFGARSSWRRRCP